MKAEQWRGVKNLRTRDGHEVRIDTITESESYPISGAVKIANWESNKLEWVHETWTAEGCYSKALQAIGQSNDMDLVWPVSKEEAPMICSTLIITPSGSVEIFDNGTVSVRAPNFDKLPTICFNAADFKKIVAHYWLHNS